MKKLFSLIVAGALAVMTLGACASTAMALDFTFDQVDITHIDANKLKKDGGCMIYVPEFAGAKDTIGSCKPNWISMQCDEGGDTYAQPESARLMYANSLAVLLHEPIKAKIVVRQARKLDGFCVLQRIQIFRPT